MPSWNSRGLRGSILETLINMTNEKYREKGLALVQKIPTPITPINIDTDNKQITLAYFEQKSTVDYIGVVQGVPVCFDAKECKQTTFPLANVHEHQIRYMHDFEAQGGVAFLIIYFAEKEIYYYCPCRELEKFWQRMEDGGRKSVRYDELSEGYILGKHPLAPIHWLQGLAEDLNWRDEREESGASGEASEGASQDAEKLVSDD